MDLLNAIIDKVNPGARKADGSWRDGTCPYRIETLDGGVRRVVVDDEDGGRVAGKGATTAEAIAALAKKVGVA
jgi:hypothetical protein